MTYTVNDFQLFKTYKLNKFQIIPDKQIRIKAKSKAISLQNSFKLRTFDGMAISFGESRSFEAGEVSVEVWFEVETLVEVIVVVVFEVLVVTMDIWAAVVISVG